MDHILTRVVRRLSSACDEWLERAEDHEHGRRDRWGRRNQYWHEHEYEKQRRSEKRRERRREHEARAMRKKEKGKGEGKEEGKPTAAEAMMTGALRGGDSRHGSGAHVGSRRSHASAAPVPEAEETIREAGVTWKAEPPAGGSASRDISPMPSEHSISSIRARTEAEAAAKAKAQANADRENPPLAIDSEDEDAKSSDDDSSDEEDEAAGAAKKAKEPATAPEAEAPSGIRGGGAESDDNDHDNEEYCEAEDFDEEYHSQVPSEGESASPAVDKEAEAGSSSCIPPSRDRRPYVVRGSDLPENEDLADRQDERVPERDRRPYHCRGIIPDEASTEPGSSSKQKTKKGKRSEASQPKPSSKKAEPSQPNTKSKRAAKPDRDRWANFGAQYKTHEQHRYAERPRRTRRAEFPRWKTESKSKSSEESSESSDSETESDEIPESCRNWRYVKTPESSKKAESSRGHKPRRKMKSSSESSESAPEPPRKQKGKGKSRGKGKARANEDEPPPPRRYDSIACPQNHYAALGLREDATTEQIKSAARKLRIQTHPDRLVKAGMSDEDIRKLTMRSMRVGEAADVLCDEDKKEEYDDKIWQWKQEHGGVLPKEPDIC
ncbi:MAG: hypothetical protein Q9183_004471 [Haloplaca sp. 2 TL-2023]